MKIQIRRISKIIYVFITCTYLFWARNMSNLFLATFANICVGRGLGVMAILSLLRVYKCRRIAFLTHYYGCTLSGTDIDQGCQPRRTMVGGTAARLSMAADSNCAVAVELCVRFGGLFIDFRLGLCDRFLLWCLFCKVFFILFLVYHNKGWILRIGILKGFLFKLSNNETGF